MYSTIKKCMKSKFIFRLLPLIAFAITLQSCRTNEDFLSAKEESYYTNKFQVFTSFNNKPVDYAKGFSILFEKYDSIHGTSYTRSALLKKGNFNKSDAEYVEFNLHSQEMLLDDGERWIVYPIIKNNQVGGLMVGILRNEETEVEFRTLDSGSSYYTEVIEVFRMAFMKSNLKLRSGNTASRCGFDGSDACDIEGVIISSPPRPRPGGGGPKGGCTGLNNCMNPDIGGGGGPGGNSGNEEPTPCFKIKAIGMKDKTKSLMSNLKGKTNLTSEHGFLLNQQGNTINETAVQGNPGTGEIEFNVNAPINGFIHSHYGGLLSVFSPYDIFMIAQLYKQGLIADMNSFIAGVVTASDTQYIMIIDDPVKFGAFAANLFEGNAFDEVVLKNYEFVYDLFGIDYDKTVTNNEKGFYNYLEKNNTGLKIFKGDNNMQNWGLLVKDSNGNVTPQNCP